MVSVILIIYLQSLFLRVYLNHMLTPLFSAEALSFVHPKETEWSGEVAGWSCVVCRQPKVQLWLCIEGAAQAGHTAVTACHQLLCFQSVSALCRVCATAGCAGHQPAPVWTHGLCSAAPGSRMVIRGINSAGSWKHSCQTLSQVCTCLLITTQSVSISFDLQSILWPAKLPMLVLGHSRLCPKI